MTWPASVRKFLLKKRTKIYQVVEKWANLFTTLPKKRIFTRFFGSRIVVSVQRNDKVHMKLSNYFEERPGTTTVIVTLFAAIPGFYQLYSSFKSRGFLSSFKVSDFYIPSLILVVAWLVLLTLFVLKRTRQTDEEKVFSPESRFYQDIREIMEHFLSQYEIHFDKIKFNKVATVNDLVRVCSKSFYPSHSDNDIKEKIIHARRHAYTQKYTAPRNDDEKIRVKDSYGNWVDYFHQLIESKGVSDIGQYDVIDVGFGNGNAYCLCEYFKKIKSLTIVDLSKDALDIAKKSFPNAVCVQNDAESLESINNSSVDIYLSFRTYQSTLFDRRAAVHEAFRVIRPGGIIVISIPKIYVAPDGEVIEGLSDPTKKITKKYLYEVVNRISSYIEMLGFKDITTWDESPYETYIYGKKQ